MNRFTVFASVFTLTALSYAGDWPGYRGPAGDGVHPQPPPIEGLPDHPEPEWLVEVGESYSGLSYADGRVYTCGSASDGQIAYSIDAATGRVIWRRAFAPAYHNNWGNGPRSTPTVDGERVYIVSADGALHCLNAEDGSTLWKRSLGPRTDYGHSGSAVVEGDLVIVCAGSEDGALVAFDKKTGDMAWGAGYDKPGYATPFLFDLDGRRYAVGFMATSAVIADVETGREVWNLTWRTRWDANASPPIASGGMLFLTSAYGTGSALYELRRENGWLRHREIWRSGTLQNQFTGFVLYDGHLYGASEGRRGELVCVEFKTGDVKWSARRDQFASVKVAGGYLVVQNEKGEIEIAPATPDGYEPVWSAPVVPPTERRLSKMNNTWQAPLLINGKLFARNMLHVVYVKLD